MLQQPLLKLQLAAPLYAGLLIMDHAALVRPLRQLLRWQAGGNTVTYLVVGLVAGVVLLVLGTVLVLVLLLRARRLQQEAVQATTRRGPPGWCSTDPTVRAPSVSAPSTSSRRPSVTTLTVDGVGLELNRSFPGTPRGTTSRQSIHSATCDAPRAPAGISYSGRTTPEADGGSAPPSRRSRASTTSSVHLQQASAGREGHRFSPRATTGGASPGPGSPRISKGSQLEGSRSAAGSPTSSNRSTREAYPAASSKGGGVATAGSSNA
jgi:hypothetical protein